MGPTVTVTTTVSQRINASLTTTIDSSSSPSWGAANICFRASPSGAITVTSQPHIYFKASSGSGWVPLTANKTFTPGPGTWDVGLCQAYNNLATPTSFIGVSGLVTVTN
jgi:hypothetical protein